MSNRRFLDPLERSLEVLFGLVMVLACTASIDIAASGTEDVRVVLYGAIGCSLAWAFVDAGIYMMGIFTQRARGYQMLSVLRHADSAPAARVLIAEVLPPAMVHMLADTDLEVLRRRLTVASDPEARLSYEDYLAGAAVFVIVFASTLPVVLPFVVLRDTAMALRVSQSIGVVMLFGTGWSLAKYAGLPRSRFGVAMACIGVAFTVLTFALGG